MAAGTGDRFDQVLAQLARDLGQFGFVEHAQVGGRVAPLRAGTASLGEVVFLPPGADQPRTLADRERQAIVDTLQGTHGRLAETARRLGISRTTLWRRLRAYGLRPGNGKVGGHS
jgi:transcriptional regulator of acetoin/glycerol metabolism